jgi:hypothetical protein
VLVVLWLFCFLLFLHWLSFSSGLEGGSGEEGMEWIYTACILERKCKKAILEIYDQGLEIRVV